jgi:hypothetical protein
MSHKNEYLSSGSSPTPIKQKQATSPALSSEDLHAFAEAMQRIFDEPCALAPEEFVGKAAA